MLPGNMISRNDTSFPMMITEELKNLSSRLHQQRVDNGDRTGVGDDGSNDGSDGSGVCVDVISGIEFPFLLYYQNMARHYMRMNISSRGLLVHHEMGLGKSILAVAIAIDHMSSRQPIILLTKSLTENMRGSIVKYVKMRSVDDKEWPIGMLDEGSLQSWIDSNFSFVSMNASNMIKQVDEAAAGEVFEIEFERRLESVNSALRSQNLDGKILIVDEAHNLFRAITNGSKNGMQLYDLVCKSTDLKIVFLTGTPISNNPFELVPCFNMLGGVSKLNATTGNVLPIDYNEFQRLYISENGSIANRGYFQNRIVGLVSSVRYTDTIGEKYKSILDAAASVAVTSKPTAAGVAATTIPTAKPARPPVEFPHRNDIIVEHVVMEPRQLVNYELARDREREEGKKNLGSTKAPLTKPKSRGTSTYRVKSRQLSNYDPGVSSPKFVKMLENITARPGLTLVYSQFVASGLTPFAQYLEENGWSSYDGGNSGGYGEYSGGYSGRYSGGYSGGYSGRCITEGSAISGALDFIDELYGSADYTKYDKDEVIQTREEERGIIATSAAASAATSAAAAAAAEMVAAEMVAAEMVAAEMSAIVAAGPGKHDNDDRYNITDSWTGGGANSGDTATKTSKKYLIISGDVKMEQRSAITALFNSKENAHGELCSLLLVSSTGAEGLDLKRLRYIHIMEPYWNWGRIEQIIARGVRTNSHIDLPADEKNVTPYVYLAVKPTSEKTSEKMSELTGTAATRANELSTDVDLYTESIRSNITNESFIQAMAEVSIECMVLRDDCRTCAPTGNPLYSDDPAIDIIAQDPCIPMETVEQEVKSVIVDDVEYYYNSSDSVFGISAYRHDKKLDAYTRIEESEPLFDKILEATGVVLAMM
tara:strand:- start:12447 stop:15077 length:2631 start_codon:yes stop_codon:yes gene_type:complete